MDKHTPGEWKVIKSLSKPAFNVIGTVLGGKYKIARCPYLDYTTVFSVQELQDKEIAEARANAELIASAPLLLEQNRIMKEALEKIVNTPVGGYEGSVLKSIAKRALTINSK